MNDIDNSKVGLKFWIAALAFSVLLLAVTFALMATVLAEIRNNSSAALARTDIMTDRLNSLDNEVMAIHHHIVEEKTASNATSPSAPAVAPTPVPVPVPESAPAVPAPAATPLVKDVTPPAALPKVEPPVMTPPATPAPAPGK